MYKELAEHAAGDNLLPPLTRMQNAINAAQASATRLSRFNPGVNIFSMVVYTGEDQAARQASAVVVGNAFGREVLAENIVDITQALNGVADTLRYVVYDYHWMS